MIETLLKNGLSLLAKAVGIKGFDWLKEKTGIDLAANELTEDNLLALKKYEMDHEAELLRITTEAANVENQEITKRWDSDMKSDSWLSKNARPVAMIGLVTATVIGMFVPSVGADKLNVLCTITMTAIGGYFCLRTGEKGVVTDLVSAWRKK